MSLPTALDARDREHLDKLIPAAWPPRRRWIAASLVVVAVIGAAILARSGMLGPVLSHESGWGSNVSIADDGSLTAQRWVPLRNDGWLPVTVEAIELPAMDGVTWTEVDPAQPHTIAPGDTSEFLIGFEVEGCHLDAHGIDVFPVRAASGVLPARLVEVRALHLRDPNHRVTYLTDDVDEVTLPVWPDQPPSWILDVIDAACTMSPDDE